MKCRDWLEDIIHFQHTCFNISSWYITFGIHDIETLILIHIEMSICMSCSNQLRGLIFGEWGMFSLQQKDKHLICGVPMRDLLSHMVRHFVLGNWLKFSTSF